jgi:SRSO17 transposase
MRRSIQRFDVGVRRQYTGAIEARVPVRWVTADEAYGNNTELRARLRELCLGRLVGSPRADRRG